MAIANTSNYNLQHLTYRLRYFAIEIIIDSKFNLLQYHHFVSIETWVNFLNYAIFEFWVNYLELKIRVIFNIRQFLTFGLVNVNWKLIQFLNIDNFWKLKKKLIELKNWAKFNFQKLKIDLAVSTDNYKVKYAQLEFFSFSVE